MISLAQSLASGAAILLSITAPQSAWVLLRREDVNFSGFPDLNAVVAGAGQTVDTLPVEVIDYQGLINGQPYWYQLYTLQSGGWLADGDPLSATPTYQAQTQFEIIEPVELVRARLEVGLQGEVALGNLNHPQGAIPVLRSPPIIDHVAFPCITVLLETRAPDVRGIGEMVIPDQFLSDEDEWEQYQGWLDRSVIQITAWSLNAEERALLRRAIQSILIVNFPIFSEAGMTLIDFPTSDNFDPQSFGVPVYQAVFQLSCQHPAITTTRLPSIHHVESTPHG